ncbi:PKD domain-containing protein [Aquisphaera insulae]|uniref:PKD domain-containing protein n=1 Tax=Aquisphaera insulae TaxID=2712864 RepID=UPI0013EA181B|nr:hypothetical protein [Aquisphaera insulae]
MNAPTDAHLIQAGLESSAVAADVQVPRAVARVEGKAEPGSSVILSGRTSSGGKLAYRWRQLAGPGVLSSATDRADLPIVVPSGSARLEFELVVANERGIDVARVEIPATDAADRKTPKATPPVADAGDDLVAVVGRQVTLSGVRSQPAGAVGHRWIQVGGPKARLQLAEGPYYTFVPISPGVYRFALVVAAGDRISDPDEVSVTVGALASAGDASGAAGSRGAEPDTLDQMARRSLGQVHAKAETIDELVAIFEEVSRRIDHYESYAGMFQELSQRLESVVSGTPGRRSLWMQRVFNPLAMGLVRVMGEEGLDLSRPEGQAAPLNQAQRARLSEQFLLMAEGFRAANKRPTKSITLPPMVPAGESAGLPPIVPDGN